jgi:hypothetical protein
VHSGVGPDLGKCTCSASCPAAKNGFVYPHCWRQNLAISLGGQTLRGCYAPLGAVIAQQAVGRRGGGGAPSVQVDHAASLGAVDGALSLAPGERANLTGCFLADVLGSSELLRGGARSLAEVVSTTVLGALLFGFGLALGFFGNRLFDRLLFALGVALGFVAAYFVLDFAVNKFEVGSPAACYALTIGSVMGAVLGGCLGWKTRKRALFLFGAAAGAALGYLLYLVYFHSFTLGQSVAGSFDNMFWACVLVGGLTGGVVCMCWLATKITVRRATCARVTIVRF